MEQKGVNNHHHHIFEKHIGHIYRKIAGILCGIYFNFNNSYKLAYTLLMPHVLYRLEFISDTVVYICSRLSRTSNIIMR